MPDWWAWAVYGGTFALTVGGKVACNAYVPWSSAVFEFCSAGKCLYYDDKIGATINAVSGIADLVSFGLASGIKDAMKESAKTAATETAKQTAKSASKQATENVCDELSKQLAKGLIKGGKDAANDATKMAAKSASKEAAKKVGQQFGKELAQGMVTETVEEVFHQGTKVTLKSLCQKGILAGVSSGGKQVREIISKEVFEEILTKTAERATKESQKFVFTEAAKKGAVEAFKKQSYKFLVKDVACAGIKGAITYNSSDCEHGGRGWECLPFTQLNVSYIKDRLSKY